MSITTYKSVIKSLDKNVYAINYKEEIETENVPERIHHVHLLDRSGSMYYEINNLIDNVIKTFDSMDDDDLISIIYFSDVNQCSPIFIGKSVKDRDDMITLLNQCRSTLSITCFSTPLKETLKIIDNLSPLCKDFNITLFTDGQPVVSGKSSAEEIKDSLAVVDELSTKILALNTIGFGYYYNKEFLQKMANSTQFGRFYHSDDIKDYSVIFSAAANTIKGFIAKPIKISLKENVDILYQTSNNSKFVKDQDNIEIKYSSKYKNWFFIITNKDIKEVIVNDEVINITESKNLPSVSYTNFLYNLAYELYYKEFFIDSLTILNSEIGSINLLESHINSFTPKERQEHIELLKNATFKRNKEDYRTEKGFIEELGTFVPDKDKYSVMSLFADLLSSSETFYVPTSEYKRVTRKVNDTFNLFQKNEEEVLSNLSNNINFNSKRMNINIRFMINGVVKINPKAAKTVDLGKEINSRIYRNHTIIKDGKLNVKLFEVIVPNDLLNKIKENSNNDYSFIKEVNEYNETSSKVLFDLELLPIINIGQSESSTAEDLLDKTIKINKLKAEQRMLNHLRKEVIKHSPTECYTKYNKEQVQVLKEHGIDSLGNYVGIDLEKEKKDENCSYEIREIEFQLKGHSSLPTVKDVLAGKKDNHLFGKVMKELNDSLEEKTKDLEPSEKIKVIDDILEQVKLNLLKENVLLSTNKLAKILSGDFWSGLEINNKGFYEYKQDGNTLVIKTQYKVEYF